MATDDLAGILRGHLEAHIEANHSADEPFGTIREQILANPAFRQLDRGSLLTALDAIETARATAAAGNQTARLLVDWGEMPQVGRHARPLFSLLTSAAAGRPTVRIRVDRSLDNDPNDPLRQVRMEEDGLWTFYVPFSLNSEGLDAKPGLYVIDVEVTFPHTDDHQPRFLQTRIRLNIPDAGSDQRELVIDGDGQSVVNLAGHDLRSFSKVVLKGDDRGIINLQNFGQPQDPAATPEKPVVFEYELKINREIHSRMPRLVPVDQPSRADAITLVAGDRRIHAIARKRATFGRGRENDICLRFWPRSAAHDEGSKGISKTHAAVTLSDDGLIFSDEGSTNGFDIDLDPVKGEKTLSHLDAHGSRQIDLPSPLSSAKHSLEMELSVFGRDPDDPDFHADLEWDDVCFETAGESPSRLWHVAKGCGIEAARIRRLNNLPDEEYVFLYRHATIGRSARDHAIVLPIFGVMPGDLRLVYAGRMFWLHSTGRATLAVDGEAVTGPCLVPLMFGHCLTINSVVVHVARLAQFHLHDDPVLRTPPPVAPAAAPPPIPNRPEVSAPPPAPPILAVSASAAATADPHVQPLRASAGAPAATPPPPPPAEQPAAPDSAQLAAKPAANSTGDPVRDALRSVAVIACREGHGSGFIAHPGILVTNYHVIADDCIEDLTALFIDPATHEQTSLPLSLLDEDPENDLAFLTIDANCPALSVEETFHHSNGHKVVVIGSPGIGGDGERLENIITDGRLGPLYSSLLHPDRWSLSVTLNPGNSGGPVLDVETGEVIGVSVAKFTTADGLALAVPHAVLADRLSRARSTSTNDATRADSTHRQRYCLRKIAGFTTAATAVLNDFAGQCGDLFEDGSPVSGERLITGFTEQFGDSLGLALDALTAELTPQLDRLRNDSYCRLVVLDDLDQALGQLTSCGRQLSQPHAIASGMDLLEDLASTLSRIEGLCDSLRVEIECSLLSGRTVFLDGSRPPSRAASFRPVAAGGQVAGLPSSESVLNEIAHAPAKPKPRYLTKSRFTLACTCPTKLFYTAKSREYANSRSDDPTMQSLANEGNRVGALARLYFPEGVLVDTLEHDAAVAQTNELLAQDEATIFEAAIRAGDLFIRADILRKSGDSLQLFEVKSKVYSEDDDGDLTTASGIAAAWLPYVRDVAFQKHVLSRAFPESHLRSFLFLPDRSKPACSGDLANKAMAAEAGRAVALSDEELSQPLLRAVNVDGVCEQVLGSSYDLDGRRLRFAGYVDTLSEAYREDRKCQPFLSPACLSCEFDTTSFSRAAGLKSGRRECWKQLLDWSDDDYDKPLAFEVGGLSAAKKRTLLDDRRLHLHELTENDINPVDDGQPGLSQSQRQWLQVRKTVDGEQSSYFDRAGLEAEMATWQFPLHFIDFETCRSVIPFFAGSTPSTLIAFQFSHHIMHASGEIEHANEFLCTEQGVDPTAAFLDALSGAVRDEGTILHYAPHEVSTLRSLAGQLRARGEQAEQIKPLLDFIDTIAPAGGRPASRSVVDLCKLVKRFYFAPSMRGSNSIKDVLPAILNESIFLRQRYAQPVYGAAGGIPSRNFSDMAWVVEVGKTVRDPYSLLPPTLAAGSSPGNGPTGGVLRNGGAAMQAYADLQLRDWPTAQRQATEQALLRYCELDTLAMVFIVEAWREWCRS